MKLHHKADGASQVSQPASALLLPDALLALGISCSCQDQFHFDQPHVHLRASGLLNPDFSPGGGGG